MFAHLLTASVVNVKTPSVMADGSKQDMAVRLCRPAIIFRRVKRHQVVVSAQRVLSPFAACCFETLWRRTGRHGEDDPAAVGTTIV